MIFVSKEKIRESRERRSKKHIERRLKASEELIKNYKYEGDK
jgi:hypothetical protein